MTFIGIDHGTTAIRFALIEEGRVLTFELERARAADMSENEILTYIEDKFEIQRTFIDLVALTYSMGDDFSTIVDIRNLKERGIKSIEGAGKKIGGGTKVFDAIRYSNIPAVAIPGLHTASKVDSRIAYHIRCLGYKNYVVSDISSNTVTVAVAAGKVIGAIDACIFAPGIYQGPLDLQAIRDIDNGLLTANQAFIKAGALKMTPFEDREELHSAAKKGESFALLALDTVALFAAMEIASMQLFLKDYGTIGEIFLAGYVAEVEYVQKKISEHLGQECLCFGRWHAAIGCAEIARDVFGGKKEIIGVDVNYP